MLHRVRSLKKVRRVALIYIAALLVGLFFYPGGVAEAATPVRGPVVVRPGGAQLYDAPDGEVLATLSIGTVFTAMARTEDMAWITGQSAAKPAEVQSGWLQTKQVIAVGVELLPVYGEVNDTETTAITESTSSAAEAEATITVETTVTGTVASGDARLNVRGGPSTAYPIIAKALPGENFPVVGRTENDAWLQIELNEGQAGWVSAAYMQITGDVSQIPVVTAIDPPAAVTPTATTPRASIQTAAPSSAAVSDLGGTLVIQSSPGGTIYAYSFDSGALWSLTNGFDPAISPNGQTVAFVRDGGENGIYLIAIDGSDERLIWSGRTRLSSPKWSPDGQWILFTRSDGSYECIATPGGCISPPNGPDGEQINLPGLETSTRYWYNLARVDRDGNNYRDIASLTSARAADWSEAGIVYQSNAGLQITADAPDAENTLVIFDYLKPFFDDPDWQFNGEQIAYMGKEASHWEIFVVNPDGSGRRALTRPATTIVDEIPSNVAPAWSPDGQYIVFLSNREENGEAGAWHVWMMDGDGSNQRVLPIDLEINYTFGGEQSLSWAR